MSGGHFDYQQYRLSDIADSIECVINANLDDANVNDVDEWVQSYSKETIAEFKTAVDLLRRAQCYAQRIDWLVSGDDGENTFHERLKEDIAEIAELDN
jgi:hypothetical protein